MIKLIYEKEQIIEKVYSLAEKTMDMDEPWEWPCGVEYYGLSAAYEAVEEKEWIIFLQKRIDEFIDLGLPHWNVNTCSMGHCLLTLSKATGDEKYNEIIYQAIEYLTNKALRFGEGALQHTVSDNDDFPEQAWADTLFMAAYFMLRVGVRDDNKDLVDDALNQFYWHIQFLQDKTNGLWYYGYSNKTKSNLSGFYWGRANAWAAYTMSRVGAILPDRYLYPKFLEVTSSLRDQLSGLKKVQTEKGLWRTVVDDEESYEELSASCGIAAAMINKGDPLYTKFAQKSLDEILQNISDDGRLHNVSGGTAVMNYLDDYRSVPKS